MYALAIFVNRRGTRNRAHPDRLDRDRRVRGAFRLFLCRLRAGNAHLPGRRRHAGAPWLAGVALHRLGAFNGFYVIMGLDGQPFISLTLG